MDAAEGATDLFAGRYRIGFPLGRGGMATVDEAFDEATQETVAIKRLHVKGDTNAKRFLREVRVLQKLRSDHVVKVIDAGHDADGLFLVMERLVGEDFGAKIRRIRVGGMPLTDVMDAAIQACDALAHAHALGIVHRDIKASNLFEHKLPDGTRVTKVLDFGIARVIESSVDDAIERTLTSTADGVLGSAPYMSPEHIRDGRKVDARSDLWAIGVTIYRLLTGGFPFAGTTTGQVLTAIEAGPAPSVLEQCPDVPEAIDAIIARCTAYDRNERYANAGELAMDLAPFCSLPYQGYGESISAFLGAAPPPPRPDPSSRTRSDTARPMSFAAEHAEPDPRPAFSVPEHALVEKASPLRWIAFAAGVAVVVGAFVWLRRPDEPPAATLPSIATSPPPIPSVAPLPTPTSAPSTTASAPLPVSPASSEPRGEDRSPPTLKRLGGPRPHPPAPAPAPAKKPELQPSPYGTY